MRKSSFLLTVEKVLGQNRGNPLLWAPDQVKIGQQSICFVYQVGVPRDKGGKCLAEPTANLVLRKQNKGKGRSWGTQFPPRAHPQ